MGRVLAPIALAVCVLAAVAAASEGLADQERPPRAQPRLPGTAGDGVYPNLRQVRDLSLPGGGVADAGVGVYPALAEPRRLTFPSPEAVEAARRFGEGREGRVAFAVGDARGGIVGQAFDQGYRAASIVKAMLLVGFLDRAERNGEGLTSADAAQLAEMIRISDNEAATAVYERLGPDALRALARRAGLRSFTAAGEWGESNVTAADQVRFFLAFDRLLPAPRRRDYARRLLERVTGEQAWGIPEVARPAWRTYFKGGWRPQRGGHVVHQAALLERGARRIAIAVLTDSNPGEAYGRETVRGIAERLLRAPRDSARAEPGLLAPIEALDGFQAPEPRRLRPL